MNRQHRWRGINHPRPRAQSGLGWIGDEEEGNDKKCAEYFHGVQR